MLRWENAIIILDEAHNVQVRASPLFRARRRAFHRDWGGPGLPRAARRARRGLTPPPPCPPPPPQEVCKGAASFDLTAQQRAAAIADLDKAIELCEARGGGGGGPLGDVITEGGAGYDDLKARLEMGRGVLLGGWRGRGLRRGGARGRGGPPACRQGRRRPGARDPTGQARRPPASRLAARELPAADFPPAPPPELERAINALEVPEAGLARPGEALLDLLAGVNLSPATIALFSDMLKQVGKGARGVRGRVGCGGAWGAGARGVRGRVGCGGTWGGLVAPPAAAEHPALRWPARARASPAPCATPVSQPRPPRPLACTLTPPRRPRCCLTRSSPAGARRRPRWPARGEARGRRPGEDGMRGRSLFGHVQAHSARPLLTAGFTPVRAARLDPLPCPAWTRCWRR
jgi:hypothetical protein